MADATVTTGHPVLASKPVVAGTTVTTGHPVLDSKPVMAGATVTTGHPVVDSKPVMAGTTVTTGHPVVASKPLMAATTVTTGHPEVVSKPVIAGTTVTTGHPMVVSKPVMAGTTVTTGHPVVASKPVMAGTTVTTGHPEVASKPMIAGTTVTTRHPMVASKPVMAGTTVTTGHPVVASKPVMARKTVTTAPPASKPVVAGTTDVTTGTCGNSGYKETENFTVFISNIPYECHYHDMKRMFEQCGSLIKFTMPRGENGHRGYAFAQYENNISYAKALMLNGHKVSGSEGENPRRLNVVHSKTTSMIHSPKTPADHSQNTSVDHSQNTRVDHSRNENNISYAEALKVTRHDVSGSLGENPRRLNVVHSKNTTGTTVTTSNPVVASKPLMAGTTVTTGHPVEASKPVTASTTVTTGHPVVASKPVMAGATVTTGHPVVASKPVTASTTVTTAPPVSKPVVAGTTDVTTGTCGNSGSKETENFTVFISNIPHECHYHDMKRMFEQCGSLIKFTMPRGDNGRRGYAFALYENNISYAKALMLNGHEVSGSEGENPRRLNVVPSKNTTGTTVTTGHPVVASKPVIAGATVTSGHPVVASKSVMARKTVITTPPANKPVVARTTDVTTGTCGNSLSKETENFTVFISNIPHECHYDKMKRMFEQCGSLIKFTMPRGDNGRRGYAFAQYENNIAYAKALMLNGHEVSGSKGENPRRLNVVPSKTTSPKIPEDQSQNTPVDHPHITPVDHPHITPVVHSEEPFKTRVIYNQNRFIGSTP
ncbi:hypothetical protein OTU49_014131, partial [Cherax quadricarinatus]